MSRPRSKQKTLIIKDDEEEQEVLKEEEQNPFSFKQFLRSKNQDQDREEQTEDGSDPFLDQSLEGAWGRVWASGGGSRSGSEEEVTRFDSHPDDDDDDDDDDEEQSRQSYEGDDETSILDPHKSQTRPRPGLQQVKQENEELKKIIRDLREQSLRDQTRVEELGAELLQWRMRDQQEAQDLETMVQSVEHNLRLMTRRALRAESSVSKLQTEVKQLQTRLEQVQAEVSGLRASESELVLTMKRNATEASERLQESTGHAGQALRTLLSEAETLRFVSELLRSIDRMSSV